MGVDGFDEDELIIDSEDRARLEKMTELEREMELAARAERLQAERQRRVYEAMAEGTAEPIKKKSSQQRRSGREQGVEDAKKSAIEHIKAARRRTAKGQKAYAVGDEEEEEEEGLGVDEVGEEGGGAFDDDYELDELDDEDDQGIVSLRWEPRERTEEDEAAAEIADFNELKSIQVRRYKLEEWITKPHFAATIPGCILRMNAGNRRNPDGSISTDPLTGTPICRYVIVQAVEVQEMPAGVHKYMENSQGWKSPYPFGPDGAKTNLWVRVSRGKTERVWPLALISNTSITESEFASWSASCDKNRPPITRGDVAQVEQRLLAADAYVYSAEDVAKMLEEKRSRGGGVKNVALERARLERERDHARERGDEGAVEELEEELRRVEAAGVAAEDARKSVISSSMAALNKKNAQRNFQTALKGGGREDGGGVGGGATLDPFSRRVTRTKNYWKTGGQDGGGDAKEGEENVEGAEAMEAEGAGVVAEADAVAAQIPSLVDLSGLDLSVLDLPLKVKNPLARRLLLGSGNGGGGGGSIRKGHGVSLSGKRTIGLDEYKVKYGGGVR